MASNIDVSGFSSDRYFSRAWHLVTQEKGWWKPVLLMAVAVLVPIVGPLAVLGYQLEWARLLAWDVNEPMRRHDIHVGELIASGWRGFVAMLGWGIANALISGLLSGVPGLGSLLELAWAVCGIFISMMIMVAAIRATIYQKIGAGYSAKNLWEMAKRDMGGLARVWLIGFVASIIQAVVGFVFFFAASVSALPSIVEDVTILYDYGSMMTERQVAFYAFDLLGSFLGSVWPAILLIILFVLFTGVLVTCLTFAGLAMWMRQFDVPAWGKSSDPLPTSAIEDAAEKDDELPVAPVAPAAPAPESAVEEKAPEVPVTDEPVEVVPSIPGDEPEIEEDDEEDEDAEKTEVLDAEVETEVIAPARAEESKAPEVFDNDAVTSDDETPAETNDDPASGDEEEPEE